jgi:hypothetical protein
MVVKEQISFVKRGVHVLSQNILKQNPKEQSAYLCRDLIVK